MSNPLPGNPATPLDLALPSEAAVSIPVFFCQFKPWRGEAIKDTYGGKAVIDYNGEPLFAELVILKLLEEREWKGVWIDTYRRRFRSALPPASCDLPPHAEHFLNGANAGRKWPAGCFDVFAWNGGKYLFAEAKRKGKDAIRDTQKQWVELALNSAVPVDSLLVVEWDLVATKLA